MKTYGYLAINLVLAVFAYGVFVLSAMIFDSPAAPVGFDWRSVFVAFMAIPPAVTSVVLVIQCVYLVLGRGIPHRVVLLPASVAGLYVLLYAAVYCVVVTGAAVMSIIQHAEP